MRPAAPPLIAALSICVATTPVMAQSHASSIDVKRGQTIEILDDQERTISGRVEALTPQVIGLMIDGATTEIHIDRIARIVRRGDSILSGTLIGLGVGAAAGVLAVRTDSCEPRAFAPCVGGAQFAAKAALLFGGVGAGIGAIVDALVRGERVVYQRDAPPQTRVIPLVGLQVRGARVALSW